MKTRKRIVMAWIVAILWFGIAASYIAHLTELYMPAVYNGDAPTSTPEPHGDAWVYVGGVIKRSGNLVIFGAKPGYCSDVEWVKQGGVIRVTAYEIPISECDRSGYNPDAPWPPPYYPVPTTLPPEYPFYDAWTLKLDTNAQKVCGTYFDGNCVDVR